MLDCVMLICGTTVCHVSVVVSLPYPLPMADIVTERKDYSAGVRKCGELARRVYRQVSQVEPARLRDVLEQNFSWTPSPTVKSTRASG